MRSTGWPKRGWPRRWSTSTTSPMRSKRMSWRARAPQIDHLGRARAAAGNRRRDGQGAAAAARSVLLPQQRQHLARRAARCLRRPVAGLGPRADGRAAAAGAAHARAHNFAARAISTWTARGTAHPPPLGPDRAVHLYRHPAGHRTACCAMRPRVRSRPMSCGTRAIEEGRLYGIAFTGQWFEVGTPAAIAPDRGRAGGMADARQARKSIRSPRTAALPMRWSPGWCRAIPNPTSASPG